MIVWLYGASVVKHYRRAKDPRFVNVSLLARTAGNVGPRITVSQEEWAKKARMKVFDTKPERSVLFELAAKEFAAR